jgi:peptidoglycan/xylan/chitin deacetylase (PgdA/CDA1 family)
LRSRIKKLAVHIGKGVGGKGKSTPILMYHSIHPEHPLAVRPGAFREQVEFLADNYRVVSLARYIQLKRENRLPEKTAVITFDDGYKDNFTYAYPVLKEFNCPATIFLATGFMTAPEGKSFGRRAGLYENLPPLTWPEAEKMLGLIEFGAHTHSHIQVSGVKKAVLEREIITNRDLLQSHLGVNPLTFAYPWGQPRDFHREVSPLIAQNFIGAVTTVFGADNRDKKINPYRLRRIGIGPADDREFFAAKISANLEFIRPIKLVQERLSRKNNRNTQVHL